VIAALGAVAVLGEAVSSRLVVAGAMVLSGVGLVLSARARQPRVDRNPRV
jgi:drug/metabolite transporter (DMT)-like permease